MAPAGSKSLRLSQAGHVKYKYLPTVPTYWPAWSTEYWSAWKKPFCKQRSKHYRRLSNMFSALGKLWFASLGDNTISTWFRHPQMIPSAPVTFAYIKCGRGLAKDAITLQDSHTKSHKKCFCKNTSWYRFVLQMAYDLNRTVSCWKNIFHDNQVVECDVTVHQTSPIFSDSPSIYSTVCTT